MANPDAVVEQLRRLAADVARRSHAPYSGREEAAILLLSDGSWIPGVRVECASFSLTIPALLNAATTAATFERRDVVALVLSRTISDEERVYVASTPIFALRQVAEDSFTGDDDSFPTPEEQLSPLLSADGLLTEQAGIELSREMSGRAVVPESDFRVGCVAEVAGGRLVPGVNVESRDWLHILCAERNALGTLISYDLGPAEAFYLSCPADPLGTPCGACRQLLAELAPSAELWMDRGENAPESALVSDLLPGFFRGKRIARVR